MEEKEIVKRVKDWIKKHKKEGAQFEINMKIQIYGVGCETVERFNLECVLTEENKD